MPGSPRAWSRRREDGLVCLGRSASDDGTRAEQLAVGVRRPGLVLSAGAPPILSPQIPAPAAQAELAQSGSAQGGARRCWITGWRAASDGFRLDVANAYLHDATLTDNPPIPPAERTPRELGACGEHAASSARLPICWRTSRVLDLIRRTVEALRRSFRVRRILRRVRAFRRLCSRRTRACMPATHFACWWRAGCSPDFIRRPFRGCWRSIRDHWPCVAFSNHDVSRTVTRFGGGCARRSGARPS